MRPRSRPRIELGVLTEADDIGDVAKLFVQVVDVASIGLNAPSG
jgi:hypothetical protein